MSTVDPVDERYARELFGRLSVEERPGFRDDLRSRILAQVGPVARTRRVAPWWNLRVPRAALAAVAVAAMLVSGSGLAAAGSLPGEPLFAVKRAAEEVVLAFAFDDATRVERLADQASARLAELERATGARAKAAAALESGRSVERLSQAATDLDARDGDAGAIARAAQTLQQAADVLRAVESTLPAEAQEGIRRAIEAAGGAERGPRNDPSASPTGAPGAAPATPDARPSAAPTPKGPPATLPGRSEPGRPATAPTGPPTGRPASGPPSPPRPSPARPSPPATGP
ncbi:MAG: DUF5667 domain-containing protein [Candidatus Limnocylindria bacterium]